MRRVSFVNLRKMGGQVNKEKNKIEKYKVDYAKKIVNIIYLFSFVVIFSILMSSKAYAAEDYIYFDLSAGNVTLSTSSYTGYIYATVDGTTTVQTVSGTHVSTNKYYVYQSNSGSTSQSYDENGVPIYDRLTYDGKSWGDYITNNTNISGIVTNWNTATSNVGRTDTGNRIGITGTGSYDVTIDNLWSSFVNSSTSRSTSGISYMPGTSGNLILRLKGDNRFSAIQYACPTTLGVDTFVFENGDVAEKPGTITVASYDGASNHYNSVIGGCDSNDSKQSALKINGGVVYTGAQVADNCSGIGGGGNGKGIVEISGGTVTSVVNSSGAAIGGGIGESSKGGNAQVTITGGKVYAYNFGYVSKLSGSYYFIPGAAIGGGSSCRSSGNASTIIDITGGYVYAQSMGGAAIGGGSSTMSSGGSATIEIGGTAVVEAQSIGGTATNGDTVNSGVSIGGGTAGASGTANGGNITLTISGGTLYTGSIGGGNCANTTGKIGSGTVTISDGTIRGQVVMGKGSTDKNYFTMTGGTINNKLTPIINSSYTFETIEPYGGAVCLKYGDAILEGGNIKNCSSENGGAIYVDGGDFELSGTGKIENCNATNGGAVYISGGNATINGGTITNSNATSGGAISVSGGNVTINDGTITTSEATTGGAVYISGGNMTLTGGTITNSKATNGGGVYISNGNITMDGGTISNNQAEEFGGGIYAFSDTTDLTITITSGSIIGNIASKNGGGVGVNMGTGLNGIVTVGLESCKGLDDSHSHPIIKDNTSSQYGGGFWLNGDSMTMNMYCGFINDNIAILESGSSNLYQTGGNVIVHAGEIGEGVIVIGGEYIYIPDNQLPEIKIIYDSNNPDNPEQTIAYVTQGVEVYLPKNTFIRDGYVLYGWSTEANPTSDDGIFESGTPFLVEEEIIVYAVWKKEGSGHIKTPIIKSGKHYTEITGGTNVMISQDSAFTAQMSVLQMEANYYANRTLIFDKNLVNGTNITMVDLTNANNIQYYYYKVENDSTTNIPLTEFTKNGTTNKFVNSTSADIVDESFLFIVDLPTTNTNSRAMQLTLKREPTDSDSAAIEQSVTYTTTEKRSFSFSYNVENGNDNIDNVEDTIKFSYGNVNSTGEDSHYANRNMALVIMSANANEIPEGTKIWDGTNYYSVNLDGTIIIPIGSAAENNEVNINLISQCLNEIGCNLKAELWVSANTDSNNPFMGEKVGEISNILLNLNELPAIKVNMDKKVYISTEFNGELTVEYETINLDGNTVSVELQKKNANNIYETQNGVLTSVNGNTTNTNGVFDLELNSSGNINLKFTDDLKQQYGTYRILIKKLDENESTWQIPCNFILIE